MYKYFVLLAFSCASAFFPDQDADVDDHTISARALLFPSELFALNAVLPYKAIMPVSDMDDPSNLPAEGLIISSFGTKLKVSVFGFEAPYVPVPVYSQVSIFTPLPT